MKNKRLLSLLLCICLAASCLAGITVSASADDTISYTVKKGDYLYQVCKRNGLDYYTCKNAIMILNGWSTETQCNRIVPGQVVYLPASNDIAKTVKASASTTTSSTETVTINGKSYSTTTTTTSNVATKNGDTVSYYLVPYTVKAGDYLAKICSDLNTSYTAYKNIINSVNGLSGTRIYAGKTLYIPTSTPPAGSSCYAVIAHRVDTGETMTTICNGLNGQPASSAITQGVNYGININYIAAGQVVYVPVATTSPINPSPSPVPGPVSGKYEIGFTSAQHGDAYAMVGTAIATSTDAGKTVTIMPNADDGYAQKSVSVTRTDTKSTVPVENNQFTMPASAVKVSVTYAASKSISKASTKNGSFSINVNGVPGQTAAYGASVQVIPTPKSGYTVSSVKYWRANETEADAVAVNSNSDGDYYFNMPNYNVKVKVDFEKSQYYKIITTSAENAKVSYSVDDIAIENKAAKGVTVGINITPDKDYAVESVVVKDSADKELTVSKVKDNKYSFKMPGDNVKVTVMMAKSKLYEVTQKSVSGGTLRFYKLDRDGNKVFGTKFYDGDTVYIKAVPNSKKQLDGTPKIAIATGTALSANTEIVNELYSFTMPTNTIVVTPSWKDSGVELFNIWNSTLTHASFQCYDADGYPINMAAKDQEVTLKIYVDAGYAIDDSNLSAKDCGVQVISWRSTTDMNRITPTAVSGKTYTYEFTMPDNVVCILAIASAGSEAKQTVKATKYLKAVNADSGADVDFSSFAVKPATLKVMSDCVDVASDASIKVEEGTRLEIKVENLQKGYKIDKVWAYSDSVRNQTIKPDGNGRYFYTITRKDCTDTEICFSVQLTAETFELLYSYPAHGTYTINEFSNTVKAFAGETITVANATVKSGEESQYEFGKLLIDDVDKTANMEGGAYSFTMPANTVKTQVTFKEK